MPAKNKCLIEWTGIYFRVGFPDGCILTTTHATPGHYAHWIKGSGNRTRREQIMETNHTTYSWSRDSDSIAADFAAHLGGTLVDDLEAAMTERYKISDGQIFVA
jgi:hypothetical protein